MGASNYGHQFESCIYKRLGCIELEDQIEGLIYLITQGKHEFNFQNGYNNLGQIWDNIVKEFKNGEWNQSRIDPTRVSIYGWSYGKLMIQFFYAILS